jgi:hypothetical protein
VTRWPPGAEKVRACLRRFGVRGAAVDDLTQDVYVIAYRRHVEITDGWLWETARKLAGAGDSSPEWEQIAALIPMMRGWAPLVQFGKFRPGDSADAPVRTAGSRTCGGPASRGPAVRIRTRSRAPSRSLPQPRQPRRTDEQEGERSAPRPVDPRPALGGQCSRGATRSRRLRNTLSVLLGAYGTPSQTRYAAAWFSQSQR